MTYSFAPPGRSARGRGPSEARNLERRGELPNRDRWQQVAQTVLAYIYLE